jgi:transcription elongation factor GreA
MADHEMTAEGLAALKAEIARLEGEGRAAIAEDIKTARDFGDLKENAEYHDAKERQAHLETKILRLRDRLTNAVVVEGDGDRGGGAIGFGSTVEVRDDASGRVTTYTLVSSLEADVAAGKLSVDSPVAQALRGKHEGEDIAVTTPRGSRTLRVVKVS